MKKTLVIVNHRGTGGAEKIAENIAKHFDFPIFYLTKALFSKKHVSLKNTLIYGTTGKFYKYNPLVLRSLIKYCDQNEIEILYPQLGISLFYAVFCKLLRPKLKIVYHEHGEFLYNKPLQHFIKFFHSSINIIISVSEAIKQKLSLIHLATFTLNNSIENRFFNNTIHVPNSTPTIAYIGRLSAVKGFDILIDALIKLQFKWDLHVCGEGPLKAYVQSKLPLLKENGTIHMHGFTDPLEILQKSDLLISPSRSEAFGLVIAETMAAGVPVISSDIESLKEFVINQKTAITFKSEDSTDLAQKITRFCNHEYQKSSLITNAKESVARFSEQNYYSTLEELLSHV